MIKGHWLTNAKKLESPHCDERPQGVEVSLLVIHNISLPPEVFTGDAVERFFTQQLDFTEHPFYQKIKDLKVSSHLFIRRTGEVVQFVPFNKRAWHAGVSEYRGRPRCNDFSIGIELEGSDHQPFEEVQYQVLAQVTKVLMTVYPSLSKQRMVGHSDIAPGRKTDPGPFFDWMYFYSLIGNDSHK